MALTIPVPEYVNQNVLYGIIYCSVCRFKFKLPQNSYLTMLQSLMEQPNKQLGQRTPRSQTHCKYIPSARKRISFYFSLIFTFFFVFLFKLVGLHYRLIASPAPRRAKSTSMLVAFGASTNEPPTRTPLLKSQSSSRKTHPTIQKQRTAHPPP